MAEPTHFHDYVTVVTNIDRRKYGKRIVPMKVLMLGMPRMGTESIKEALQFLGINPVYHGYQAVFDNPRDCEMWNEALDAKFNGKGKPYGREEFDKLLGHCQAVSDMPAICFADDLIGLYPEAKVILPLRDADSWYKSFMKTLQARQKHPTTKYLIPITFWLNLHSRFARIAMPKAIDVKFDGDFEKNGMRVLKEHNDMIRSLVPKERLLEYHVGDGWKPICDFLDCDVPDRPFPSGNEKDVLILRFKKALLMTLLAIARAFFWKIFVLGACLYATFCFYRLQFN